MTWYVYLFARYIQNNLFVTEAAIRFFLLQLD